MNDRDRDILRKTILELISRGHVRFTAIEKRCVASCLPFATSHTFRHQFYGYLLSQGYIQRVAHGTYALTDKGQNYLALLT
jgi:predicted transcriptional regulator